MSDGILVKVLNIDSGIHIYNNIKFIRILSEKYNLLIMRDYLPVIGELNGSVEIVGDESIKLKDIKGYYINRNNEFNLIVKEGL